MEKEELKAKKEVDEAKRGGQEQKQTELIERAKRPDAEDEK